MMGRPHPPQPIKALHLVQATKSTRCIELHVCPQAVSDIRPLGRLSQVAEGDLYNLKVSPLYDFAEVLSYLQALAAVPVGPICQPTTGSGALLPTQKKEDER
jgi:hypothetical protein